MSPGLVINLSLYLLLVVFLSLKPDWYTKSRIFTTGIKTQKPNQLAEQSAHSIHSFLVMEYVNVS